MTRKEEIEARKVEIRNEVEAAENVEKVERLEEEVDALNEEIKQIESHEEDEGTSKKITEEKSKVIEREERKMKNEKELRNSKEYIEAYAEYVKTGKDEELRSLLSENVSDGTIAVPDFVLEEVKTAWEKSDIMSLVTKTELKGNLKVQFEISGSDAVVHTEGTGAVDEEDLKEGIATISPGSIKKWISISDEVMDLRGEAFLRYIYDELTYKIVKKVADLLIAKIAALPQTATKTSPSAVKIAIEPKASTIATAFANLSDEASNPVITMNKLTYAKFKEVQYANNYGVDIFEGFDVKFNNTLPAYDTAESGAVYMIVGDYGHGVIANFPNGDEVNIKLDELTRKKEDLVEILGRQYVGVGVVADKAFTLVAKPELTV
jgi:HK97 family phage major capsid protein